MKKKKLSSLKRAENRFSYILLAYSVIMYLVFGFYGQLRTLAMMFTKMDAFGGMTFLGFDNLFANFIDFFNDVFSQDTLGMALINSVKTWGIIFIISNPLYLIFSFFAYKKFPGSKFFSIVAMLPDIISGLIFCLIFKQVLDYPLPEVMNALGYENFPNLLGNEKYVYGVVIFYQIWVSFGMSTIYYVNAYSAIDPAIIESAEIDGINGIFQELWYINLPLVFPTFSTLVVIGLTTVFTSDFGLMAFFKFSAPKSVYTVGYYNILKIYTASSTGYPKLAVMGFVLTAILTPVILYVKKLFDRIDPTN